MFRSAFNPFRHPRAFSIHRILRIARQQSTCAIGPDDPHIIRVVRRKLDERNRLQSELPEDSLSDEDIKRVRRIRELEPLQDAWTEWSRVKESLTESASLLDDADPIMKSMAEEEYASCSQTLAKLVDSTFPSLLVPPSKTRHLSAILEIRAGVGGSESALFVGDLARMYTRTSQSLGWNVTILDSSPLETGGMRDTIIEVKGDGTYDALRWESGVHRVQRIPATDAGGRVHTSTVGVMVLPLVEDTDSNVSEDKLFDMADVKVEVMRSRGAGGQHVNKTESAVRLTHLPTGISVSMQDERSQHQNRRRAFQVLRARLMDRKLTQEMVERRDIRRNLVQSSDRSEKIRTYNYPQDRVTDHRLGMSVKNIGMVMEGSGLQDFLEALQQRHHDELLEDALLEN